MSETVHSTAPIAPGEQTIDAEVVAKRQVCRSVVTLELQDVNGELLPAWEPGAHIDLVLPNGLLRQYSLCGDNDDRSRYRVAVLREVEGKGGSAYVHDELQAGDRVEVRGPRNHFMLEPAERYRFIAGGIGITPILPMVAEAERRGASWDLIYLGRSEDRMAFLDELAAFPSERVQILLTVDRRPPIEEVLGPPGPAIYACGPSRLLDAIEEASEGLPAGTVHLEHFEPDREALAAPTSGFRIVLTDSGKEFEVPPDKSILDMVEAAGIDWPYSCREGTCGTCETRIVAGEADHRDAVLSSAEKAENEYMMICVSRAAGPLLELEI